MNEEYPTSYAAYRRAHKKRKIRTLRPHREAKYRTHEDEIPCARCGALLKEVIYSDGTSTIACNSESCFKLIGK